MDIKCPACGEPWDLDSLHDNELGLSFDEAYRRFRTEGCRHVLGNPACTSGTADPALAGLAELLDDDVDGYAAMTEDFGL
jgi:hypothetical protein